ncbi:MAG: FkbM family methyltransferase, partial [Alphaproteobacteria bacterium]
MKTAIARDPAPFLRLVEKTLLMLRYVWRFPRVGGAWPKYEYLKPWFAALQPATVVDVGVNRGQFIHLAARLFPRAAIIGIEPLDELHRRVGAIYAGDDRVTLQCCACGADEGETEFFVTANDQNASTHRPTEAFYEERAGERVVQTRNVPVRRLDRLLSGHDGPMLIKIDVQGGEMEVLEGLGEKLADVMAIVIEAPFEGAYEGAAKFDDIYRYLTARGFAYRGALGQLNSPRTGHVRQEDSVYL